MGLNMNLVFNLSSVEELDQLCKALKETATLQAKMALEEQIRSLNKTKERLGREVEALKMERDELRPKPKDEETDKKSDDEEGIEEDETPSSLRRDGEQIIERLIEGNEDVDVSPGPPE